MGNNIYDVILVNSFFDELSYTESMGISFLGGKLRSEGYRVKLIDPGIRSLSVDNTIEILGSYSFKAIGISILTDDNFPKAIEFCKKLREGFKDILIFAGGHSFSLHAAKKSQYAYDILKYCDCGLVGEGENVICQLLEAYNTKQSYEHIEGLVRSVKGEITINPSVTAKGKIDSYPFMIRDLYEEICEVVQADLPASILCSRGCAYSKCNYCTVVSYEKLSKGPCFRERSIENIIDEIKLLHKQYKINKFNFEDDNFLLPGKGGRLKIERFCKAIKELDFDIEFTFFCRIDSIDYECFKMLKECGLKGIYLGIETVLESTLKLFNKGICYEQIEKALKILEDLGYSSAVGAEYRLLIGYIMWHPYTTTEELKGASKFVKAYKMPPKLLQRKLKLYTGSPLYTDYCRENGLEAVSPAGWKYKIEWMQEAERLINIYFDMVNKSYRDKIRTVEKLVEHANTTYSGLEELIEIRELMDEGLFEFFDSIVECCEKNQARTKDEVIGALNNCYLQKVQELEAYIKEKNIGVKIAEALEILKINSNATNVFRK